MANRSLGAIQEEGRSLGAIQADNVVVAALTTLKPMRAHHEVEAFDYTPYRRPHHHSALLGIVPIEPDPGTYLKPRFNPLLRI